MKNNTEVDNLEIIKPLLNFDSPDDFYYLQILQRKKENPQLGSNSRVIKNYYITSVANLEGKYDEIKQLCNHFNARASIRLNRRNYESVALKALINMANSMQNKEYSFIKKSYDRAVGQGNSEPKATKTWILDVDGDFSERDQRKLINFIRGIAPYNPKEVAIIPSKSGLHIVVNPFDLRDFKVEYPEIEVHKNNPTNLYIPI
tara:strand:+ start:238 stop:846 length:609 start_codon:yes stop_codon:yes gene_type:complete